MFFFFVCGEHRFRSEVEGYKGLTCQCHNCGNWSASVVKTHPWFTLCFIASFFFFHYPFPSFLSILIE